MKKKNPHILTFGDFLVERRETPSQEKILLGDIPIIGKISFSDGKIELRNTKKTRTKMILIQPGDLVLSGINAHQGAIAIYTGDKPIAATIHYSAYYPNEELANLEYLWWLMRSKRFGKMLEQYIPGGIKTELKAKRLLPIPLDLPPLDQQLNVIEEIRSIRDQLEEAAKLRQGAIDESLALIRSLISSHDTWQPEMTSMKDLVKLRRPDVDVLPDEVYEFAGVYSFGRGVFYSKTLNGSEFSYTKLTRIHTDDFLYPKLMAWEGALGTVPESLDGMVVSPEFPVFEVNSERVLPVILDHYFRSEAVWPELASISTGTNVRRRRLHPKAFLSYKFPLPPMGIQQKVAEVDIHYRNLIRFQDGVVKELDALMPAVLDKIFQGVL